MATSSQEAIITLRKRELFEVWRKEQSLEKKNSSVQQYVITKIATMPPSTSYSDNDICMMEKVVRNKVFNFTSKLQSKWAKHSRNMARFVEAENVWLDEDIEFSVPKKFHPLWKDESTTCNIGRPSKEFNELSIISKKRKVSTLVKSSSLEELTLATRVSLNVHGHRDVAKIVKEVLDPSKTKELKASVFNNTKHPQKYSPEDSLSLFIDARLSKHSYTIIQAGAKSQNANMYPTYKALMKAKEMCYPEKDQIALTETTAEVSLQGLLDHTSKRLLTSIEKSFNGCVPSVNDRVTLSVKWGCDGSSGHSLYKQRFYTSEETDAFVFLICIVPLELTVDFSGNPLWSNPTPSSTRFCRPLKIMFKKESPELTQAEVMKVENQVKSLMPTTAKLFERDINVDYSINFTMMDGKTFSVLTDSSNQSCGICGATPKMMNNLEKLKGLKTETKNFAYGLSTLHANIRCFEYILHLAYRLEVQKWQIKDKEEKEKVEKRKKHVQNELKEQLGLLVDIPKPNYGTTNDGNTARRFFAHYETASNITGVEKDLIKRLAVILKAMSSGQNIDIARFRSYTYETAKQFINIYPWYYMPASVHRILIHGPDIIESVALPIGMLSEEALESRNKDVRRFRQFNTRKISRTAEITDLFHSLLFSSDSLISSISFHRRKPRDRKKSILDSDVETLLENPRNPHLDERDSEN